MPPMTATPIAIPQGKEHELEQEFELDIRVSSVSVAPSPEFVAAKTHKNTCATLCGCPTKATGGCCPHP